MNVLDPRGHRRSTSVRGEVAPLGRLGRDTLSIVRKYRMSRGHFEAKGVAHFWWPKKVASASSGTSYVFGVREQARETKLRVKPRLTHCVRNAPQLRCLYREAADSIR